MQQFVRADADGDQQNGLHQLEQRNPNKPCGTLPDFRRFTGGSNGHHRFRLPKPV